MSARAWRTEAPSAEEISAQVSTGGVWLTRTASGHLARVSLTVRDGVVERYPHGGRGWRQGLPRGVVAWAPVDDEPANEGPDVDAWADAG